MSTTPPALGSTNIVFDTSPEDAAKGASTNRTQVLTPADLRLREAQALALV